MILTKLKLVNFRNYKKLNIQLNKNLNIFIGPNAQGKTNILESIYILAITKSHRSGTESNLIRIGDSAAKISGTLKEDKLITDLEVDISPVQKKVFKNQSEIKKISNYIGNLNVIMFCPDDLDLLKKSPVNRRNYLNIQISQLDGQYLRWLNEYNKILKTKNEYLKVLSTSNRQTDSYLETLEEQLIVRAVKIYELRMEYISRVNKLIPEIYKKITGLEGLHIAYDNGFGDVIDPFDYDEYGKILQSKFHKNRKREIMQGTTLYGPHRDDFSFYLNEIDLKVYGSQGQQRIAVISFKLAEIQIFKELTKKNPLLLLDDIFSEIDIKKRNRLLKYIDGSIQTIITTTDLKNINKKIVENAKIFKVIDGTVTEKVGK